MNLEAADEPIRTRRLEIVTLTQSFVDAITARDLETAEWELGASVSRWLATDASHLVQLRLAGRAAATEGYQGFGRVIMLPGSRRRAIGSIGFHGPPDDRGRLEVGCRIHPAHRGRGYGAEATAALLDWATRRFGVTRFLLAVRAAKEAPSPVPIEIETRQSVGPAESMGRLSDLLEGERRRS